jgi:hypothetical protein
MTVRSKTCAVNNVNTDGGFPLVKTDNHYSEKLNKQTQKNRVPFD